MIGFSLGEIAAALGGELIGDPDLRIERIGTLEGATPTTIAFLANVRYRAQLGGTMAACVIVGPDMRDAAVARGAALVAPDPYLHFARLTQWWAARTRAAPAPGVHPSAVVDRAARIDASASVGALAVVEVDAEIGAGCSIGERGIVHSGAVIGADGFGFAPHHGEWVKIEQLGAVRIGDDVEIGANTCIDRGALGDTVIEDGVKLDNQVQVGHNTRIGAHSAAAGCVGISGSTTIGKRCTLGGAVGVAGHLTIADDVHVTAFTGVSRSLTRAGVYSGLFPIDDNATWEKNAATLRQLYSLRNRLRALEKKTP